MDGLEEIRKRYPLAPSTFASICKIPPQPDRSTVFHAALSAVELQPFAIRPAERAWLRHINEHTPIPYPIREPVAEPRHKASLLVQMDLTGEQWLGKLTQAARRELLADRRPIYRVLDQALRCAIDVLGHRGDGRGVSVGLDVLRSVHARVWEGAGGVGSGNELLQVEGIGAARLRKLADAGVRTVRRLASLECYHIERLMSRNPPYGQTLLRQLAGFPLLTLDAEGLGEQRSKDGGGDGGGGSRRTMMVRVVMGFENKATPVWKGRTPWVSCVMEALEGREEGKGKLLWFWRGSVKRLAVEGGGGGGKEVVVGVTTGYQGCKLRVTLACEVLVGTMVQKDLEL
ncbi:Sec63 domain protein [Cordyceps fumosorosea ARSEF 2679]|uniref:Sec63 domain protein n=1 Tax=Cordyceps fumosorosea (strain ARSEF 2679) TaxID=1081104 RepID=A0A162J507_CORFA|nr:Sec63 domain protein [Cordyceps fumosorosea ARSEF 2679]OAA63812.1 Sec63 domain protein [Cordyceps fumosorosea ARSEF 2679]